MARRSIPIAIELHDVDHTAGQEIARHHGAATMPRVADCRETGNRAEIPQRALEATVHRSTSSGTFVQAAAMSGLRFRT